MIARFAMFSVALALTSPAFAQASAVSLTSDVMVEHTTTDAQGHEQVALEAPRVVVPGDKLVFVLRYHNNGRAPANDFVITNPLPSAVAFQSAADGEVSVDGGHSFGSMATRTVRQADGTMRPARSDEVTHIRWAFAQPIPAGQAGRLMFRGVVR